MGTEVLASMLILMLIIYDIWFEATDFPPSPPGSPPSKYALITPFKPSQFQSCRDPNFNKTSSQLNPNMTQSEQTLILQREHGIVMSDDQAYTLLCVRDAGKSARNATLYTYTVIMVLQVLGLMASHR